MVKHPLTGTWQFRAADADEWLPAAVPGSVHTDLLALGRIPDPFVADNELLVQWVAERDWEYRCLFDVPPQLQAQERIFLVCDGLDTLAEVVLNGQTVGRAENMFRRYEWDVTTLLREGKNELLIRFTSPIAHIRARQAERPMIAPSHSIPGGPYLRKAPCQFGWDWGPQLPPIGIWKEVYLKGYSVARFADVHLRQHHGPEGQVTLTADITLDRWREADLTVVLHLTAPDGRVQRAEVLLPGNGTSARLEMVVADPYRWWPNGYGSQPLYRAEVTLCEGKTPCDRCTLQIGLRTLELCRQKDEWGESFVFVVNGVPIFAKGANWIPADSFPTRITDEHLEHLIRSAAEANMNMLRVWGGGFYEDDRFYDLCDRYGILVWQDFVFSCSTYPLDEEKFLENVQAEVVENVRRLRHRASLALWCGNNEMEWGWESWGWIYEPGGRELRAAYDRFFHHILPEICAREDPDRAYWPSSPSSGTPFVDVNGGRAGDTHCWEVWHWMRPFRFYREHVSRFVSEFGFQSLPPLATVRTYADEADWNITSYIMEHHQRNAEGNGKIVAYLTEHFRMPKDFPSLVYLSQILQAEAVRTGVEHWRRNRHRVGGTLYWQLNDCWLVASWSSIDHFGRWKALHYAARRFYAPVLLSVEDDGPRAALFVTSDLREEWRGTVRWSLETVDGKVLLSGKEEVTVPTLSSVQVWARDFSDWLTAGPSITLRPNFRRDVVLVYELWQGDERLSIGVIPFVPTKHLELPDPQLRVTVRQTEDGFAVDVTSGRLARFVWLELEDTDAVFSDNFFDLPAGRTVTATLPPLPGWTAERVRQSLRVRSLRDSY